MKRFVCLLLGIFLLLPFLGCSDDQSNGKIISYSLTADPINLDPQVATDYNAILVINNIFEGLLTKSPDGSLTEGAAESYTVSSDGLEYIFTLRQDTIWMRTAVKDQPKMTTHVTAHDFVFAFQRLFDPETKSVYAPNFYCIQNARSVNNGSDGVDQLGVTALSDYVLKINLEYANSMFPELLTTSPAMPCNQDFFNSTIGRYGLDQTEVLANGPFYLKTWSKNNYVHIRANPNSTSPNPTIAGGANLTVRDADKAYDFLSAGDIDSGVLDYAHYARFKSNKFNTTEFENTVWGIGFNANSEYFSNNQLRTGMAMAVDRSVYSDKLTDDLLPAGAIIPNSVSILNKNYRELAGNNLAYEYDPASAREHFKTGMNELGIGIKKINTKTVIVPEGHEQTFDRISQIWQKDLDVYLQPEILDDQEYQSRLKSGKYDCAILKFTSESNLPDSILSKFQSNSKYNLLNYSSPTYDEQFEGATLMTSLDESVQEYQKAEQYLLSQGIFIPLYYQKEYFVVDKNVSDIMFDESSKLLYFKYTKKQS